MQLHLEGSEELKVERDKAYRLLTDVNFLSRSVPDAEETRIVDPTTFEAKMKIGVAMVRTKMTIKMTVADMKPQEGARLLVEGSGSGNNMKIVSDFRLEGDKPTKMKWMADAEVTGLMAGLGSSMLRGFAEKKVGEIFRGIKDAMEREP